MRLIGVATAVFISITAFGGFGQQTPPRFEVASIKPSKNRNFIGIDARPGGRLIANGPLAMLIANAYHVRQFQVSGGPAWINSDLYSIEAKTEGPASRAEMLQALQALLEDRFKLKVERQTRELGVYVLTVGKSGIKRELVSAGGCPASEASMPPGPPQPGQRPCGVVSMMFSSGRVRLEGRKATIAQLFERVSNFVDRPIIDRTGYTGILDVELEFAPDRSVFGSLDGAFMPQDTPASGENAAASLPTAVREQMGLKLESGKGPVPVITIHSVERPGAN